MCSYLCGQTVVVSVYTFQICDKMEPINTNLVKSLNEVPANVVQMWMGRQKTVVSFFFQVQLVSLRQCVSCLGTACSLDDFCWMLPLPIIADKRSTTVKVRTEFCESCPGIYKALRVKGLFL